MIARHAASIMIAGMILALLLSSQSPAQERTLEEKLIELDAAVSDIECH